MSYNDAGQLISRVNNYRNYDIEKLWEKNPRYFVTSPDEGMLDSNGIYQRK